MVLIMITDDQRQIPERLRAVCEFAPKDKPHYVNIDDDGVYQYTAGWVRNRSGGGGHGISLAERFPRHVCDYCLQRRIKGYEKQTSMF